MCAACWHALESAPVRWLASPEPGDEHDLEVRSLFAYTPEAAAMLLAAKNGGRRPILRLAGRELGRSLLDLEPVDAVSWIPAAPGHRRSRGFDQGRFLARTVAAVLGQPARSLLARPAGDTGQKGKSRSERLAGVEVVATRPCHGRLLLIDDVVTTGSSLRRGADALFAAGARQVVAATVASSDQHRRRSPEVTFGPQPGLGQPA